MIVATHQGGHGGGNLRLDNRRAAPPLAECRRVAKRIESVLTEAERARLPRCRDGDDQKFLEAARDARAEFLVTKDKALLGLAAPFRIVTPEGLAAEL